MGSWQKGDGFVQPSATRTLTIPFTQTDRSVQAVNARRHDLSQATSFRLKTSVSNSKTLLEVTLSFTSGNGEYRTGFTLHEEGPIHVLLPKQEFTAYGFPAGWNKVDGVKLSFWPREKGTTVLRDLSLESRVDPLWILDPESLAKTGDERYTSRVSVRHISRLLLELGLPHGVIPVEDVTKPESAKILILPYAPHVPDTLYRKLRAASSQGTKLIVFEGQHDGLARLLGVELGPPLTSNTVGRYNGLQFNRTQWIQPPNHIYQHTWTFRSLKPLQGAFKLATWQDARGQSAEETAAILTPKGAWFSAAWKSGDLDAKSDALRALIGYLSPWTLLESTRFYQETRSPDAFRARHPDFNPSTPASITMVNHAETLFAAARSLQAEQKLEAALTGFRKSDRLMQKAYASSQSKWNAELKGIWDQQGTGFYVGGWDETCRILKETGFNAVFSHVATSGRAHYPSAYIPGSKTLETYGDQLTAFSKAAHKYGLQAHAWKICWKLNSRDPAFKENLRKQGRLMVDDQGNTLDWLSLAHPDNIQFEINSILEILRKAPLDGIHLDYMRMPGKEADYGPAARKAFEKQIGRKLPNWPKEVLGPLKDRFQTFRQDSIHSAVKQISEAVRKEFPDTIISVAVWGAWPDCAVNQAQDWPRWGKLGWVDWLIPMNYTDNPHQYEGWLDLQRRQPGLQNKLITGIGLISTNAELNPVQLLDQLNRTRERGLKGFVLFRLDSSLIDRVFPYLNL
jgi:uncharacterized lipoprotein YddW (UPF0748 family)